MRSMRCAWLVLAGCSSGGSVDIRVMPPVGGTVDQVHLFAAVSGTHNESIQPAIGTLAPTVWWKRDSAPDFDIQPMVAEGTEYQYVAGPDFTELSALIAVGFTAGQPTAVASVLEPIAITGGEIHRYTLQLELADPLPRRATSTPTRAGVQVWGPADDPFRCVQVEPAVDGVASAMIVDRTDPDCDGYTEGNTTPGETECRPLEYASQTPLARDALACSTKTPLIAADTMACVAGGETCVDGPGTVPDSCAPSAYCLPTKVCELCPAADPRCNPYPLSRTDGTLAVPHIRCDVGYDPGAGGQEIVSFCPQSVTGLDLRTAFPSIACDDGRHAKLRRRTDAGFDTELAYSTQSGASSRIKLAPVDEPACQFEFTVDGEFPTTTFSLGIYPFPALLSVPLVKPVAGRGLALPIVFRAIADAGCVVDRRTCTFELDADPNLTSCLSAPVPAGQLVDD